MNLLHDRGWHVVDPDIDTDAMGLHEVVLHLFAGVEHVQRAKDASNHLHVFIRTRQAVRDHDYAMMAGFHDVVDLHPHLLVTIPGLVEVDGDDHGDSDSVVLTIGCS